MKGLVLKDIINLRTQYKVYIALFGFYWVMSFVSENSSMFGGMITVMMAMLTITSMAFDERSNWDKYALTMPVTRKEFVLSKYLLGAILSGVAFASNLLFQVLAGSEPVEKALLISLALFGVGVLFLSIVLPLLFKFGVEKGRLLMMLALFLPTGAILLLAKLGFSTPSQNVLRLLPYAAGALLILVCLISVLASLKIYSRKEL